MLRPIDAARTNHPNSAILCAVSGSFLTSENITAAPIVGYNMGEVAAMHLFGETEEQDGHYKFRITMITLLLCT